MKTADLIRALAEDQASAAPRLGRLMASALLLGIVATAALFLASIGPRPDIATAAETPRFLFKFVVALALALPAVGVAWRLARPGRRPGVWGWLLVLSPVLLMLAVVGELFAVPQADWLTRLVGSNARHCLIVIPLLALAPLACLLFALRQGAATRPRLAGGVAGLACGALAAVFYAANCPDDSPLFVAAWYPLAIGFVALLGALLGPRVLRW